MAQVCADKGNPDTKSRGRKVTGLREQFYDWGITNTDVSR